MLNRRLTRVSKYLTFVLRHEPQSIGLRLDADGYAAIDELVAAAQQGGKSITEEQVRQVLELQPMPLFETTADGSRVRAI